MVDFEIPRKTWSHPGIELATMLAEGTPFEEDKALIERRENLMTRLNSLREVSGVKIVLCEITRVAARLDKKKIMQGIEMVPSGVVEVARLQSEGFSYLKADWNIN